MLTVRSTKAERRRLSWHGAWPFWLGPVFHSSRDVRKVAGLYVRVGDRTWLWAGHRNLTPRPCGRVSRRLLEECDRADALAGRHGGFVATARIRELLGGGR